MQRSIAARSFKAFLKHCHPPGHIKAIVGLLCKMMRFFLTKMKERKTCRCKRSNELFKA
jgi:hypothetical protein